MSAKLYDLEAERRARRFDRRHVSAPTIAVMPAADAVFVGAVRLGVAFVALMYACATEP